MVHISILLPKVCILPKVYSPNDSFCSFFSENVSTSLYMQVVLFYK